MQEKTELEKAEYRDIARDTHFQHCKEGGHCSNVLAHTPYETESDSQRQMLVFLEKKPLSGSLSVGPRNYRGVESTQPLYEAVKND